MKCQTSPPFLMQPSRCKKRQNLPSNMQQTTVQAFIANNESRQSVTNPPLTGNYYLSRRGCYDPSGTTTNKIYNKRKTGYVAIIWRLQKHFYWTCGVWLWIIDQGDAKSAGVRFVVIMLLCGKYLRFIMQELVAVNIADDKL